MTLEEFKEIKKKVLDDIRKEKNDCHIMIDDLCWHHIIVGVTRLAMVVEDNFKKEKNVS